MEETTSTPHRSGFVNIIGRPNVGKSTLMNALVGERMSIITNKPQTTRHRIIGILSGDDFQIVFSDTPGIIADPAYKMQEAMNAAVSTTFQDADVMLFVTDVNERYEEDDLTIGRLQHVQVPLLLVLNKIDTISPEQLGRVKKTWQERVDFSDTHAISALKGTGVPDLLKGIRKLLPEGPAYYPKDQLTDRPERFFVSEIIREKILEIYHQEIPYSTEVIVERYKEGETNSGDAITRIEATIFVARKTQKSIVIGKGGALIKKLGSESRKSLEKWLDTKVYLELHVKVREGWRNDDSSLKMFGY